MYNSKWTELLSNILGSPAVNMEIWNIDKIDGSNTRRVTYDSTSYIGGNTEDVTGNMSAT